jgi:predicted metalloprotease with PDZ domain
VAAALAMLRLIALSSLLSATSLAAESSDSFPWSHVIQLSVDATDVAHGVYHVTEVMRVRAGALTLRFPKWLPGHHAPSGRIDGVAGLYIDAEGRSLTWMRDAADMYAFHLDVPAGQDAIRVRFDFMTPLEKPQGRISMTPTMLELEWDMCVLYPSGVSSDNIGIAPEVELPAGWSFATSLETKAAAAKRSSFKVVSLRQLIDSPVLASPRLERIFLGTSAGAPVHLNVARDRGEEAVVPPERVREFSGVVQQTVAVFGPPPFKHYDVLLSLSDEMGEVGWEHLESSEVGLSGRLFDDWRKDTEPRLLLTHEFIHAWNGKYRRPRELMSADFAAPMKDSLLWVYEGLTAYYGLVISARSGIVSPAETQDILASMTDDLTSEPGRRWRSLADTTNQPLVTPFYSRSPWPDWGRRISDFYDEGVLIWLDIDCKIRTLTHGRKSLDDFAASFFHVRSGTAATSMSLYELGDVVRALNSVVPYDWGSLLRKSVYELDDTSLVEDLGASGWELTRTSAPAASIRGHADRLDLSTTVGLVVDEKGYVTAVRWQSPAFKAGLVPGAVLIAVKGVPFSRQILEEAVIASSSPAAPLVLLARARGAVSSFTVAYTQGLSYPHITRIPDRTDLLSQISAPLF